MTAPFFTRNEPLTLAPGNTGEELAYRWYDPERLVLGKRMEDHLRFAVCYWHSFTWAPMVRAIFIAYATFSSASLLKCQHTFGAIAAARTCRR